MAAYTARAPEMEGYVGHPGARTVSETVKTGSVNGMNPSEDFGKMLTSANFDPGKFAMLADKMANDPMGMQAMLNNPTLAAGYGKFLESNKAAIDALAQSNPAVAQMVGQMQQLGSQYAHTAQVPERGPGSDTSFKSAGFVPGDKGTPRSAAPAFV